jgi:tyrosyl-tRNA synthetase
MPLLEGTDGVQKMSKSYGNYIGITEPPKEIYGKVMSISDQLMWRYYELLTDVTTAEIETMQRKAASGEANPMQYKKDLAQRIVSDFHGKDAGAQAAEGWAKQFQRDEVPQDLETVTIPFADIAATGNHGIRLDKLLAKAGLAESVSDGARKLKAKAVRIDGEVKTEPVLHVAPPIELTVRAGRLMKKVLVQ